MDLNIWPCRKQKTIKDLEQQLLVARRQANPEAKTEPPIKHEPMQGVQEAAPTTASDPSILASFELAAAGLTEIDVDTFRCDLFHRFLDLPPEVRLVFYDHLLQIGGEIDFFETRPDGTNDIGITLSTTGPLERNPPARRIPKPARASIFRANRQIYRECSDYLYGKLTVRARVDSIGPNLQSRTHGCCVPSPVVLTGCESRAFPFHKIKRLQIDLWATRFPEDEWLDIRNNLAQLCWSLYGFTLREVQVSFWDDSHLPIKYPKLRALSREYTWPKRTDETDCELPHNHGMALMSWDWSQLQPPSYVQHGDPIWDFFSDPYERDLYFWNEANHPKYLHCCRGEGFLEAINTPDLRQHPDTCNFIWHPRPLAFSNSVNMLKQIFQALSLIRTARSCAIYPTGYMSRDPETRRGIEACVHVMTSGRAVTKRELENINEGSEDTPPFLWLSTPWSQTPQANFAEN